MWHSGAHYHNQDWDWHGLTYFFIRIWPFLACLALNYAAFVLKLLNLVGNCDNIS